MPTFIFPASCSLDHGPVFVDEVKVLEGFTDEGDAGVLAGVLAFNARHVLLVFNELGHVE